MRWRIILPFLLAIAPCAYAHNLIQNAMDVVIWPDHVVIDARISLEEIIVSHALQEKQGKLPQSELIRGLETHRSYLLSHMKVLADEVPLPGRVTGVDAPPGGFSGIPSEQLTTQFALYHLKFTPARGPITQLHIEHDLLREFENLRGGWQVGFSLRIRQSTDSQFAQTLLSSTQAAQYSCDWPTASKPHSAPSTDAPVFVPYFRHGIEHILPNGYDHLLFVLALVLGARRLWDLVAIVTTFTLAHTLTLTLSVLGWLTLSSRIVEPIIAASIVIVALQNILWPGTSAGRLRLAVAFGFGLFHGLGFAGTLRNSMLGMQGATLALAIVAFSLGVELGHQLVVLPAFGLLQAARLWRQRTAGMLLLRWGSVAIGLGGILFLVDALRQ